jgi:hypothetical protein
MRKLLVRHLPQTHADFFCSAVKRLAGLLHYQVVVRYRAWPPLCTNTWLGCSGGRFSQVLLPVSPSSANRHTKVQVIAVWVDHRKFSQSPGLIHRRGMNGRLRTLRAV